MRHTIISTALALLVATSAAAQPPTTSAPADDRWQPWIGCWQLLDDSARGEDVAEGTRSRRVDTATRVCVTPAARGVTLTTLVGAHEALQETLVADGSVQPMSDAECRGTKRSEWSRSAPRLYSTAEISCNGQAARTISSLSMMMPGPTWVDIQMIDIQGRKNIRIRRLQPADDHTPRRSTFAGESAWTVDDVKEASAKLAPETVQAALVELKSGFDLKGRHLLDLQQAGVPENTIDLMVALSYPKRFVIDRPERVAPPPLGYGYGYGIFDAYGPMWPFYMDSMFWPSYYSPFAYRYWGAYDPFHLPGAGYVVIQPPGDDTPRPSGQGRIVDGRGYTRVTTRTPEPVRGADGDGGSAGTMSQGGSSSSGGSGVSSGGYSSGGGGGGGRTAVSRPPGS